MVEYMIIGFRYWEFDPENRERLDKLAGVVEGVNVHTGDELMLLQTNWVAP